ncbi:MAG: hypothetical protein AAGB48_08935 [Planctomycetota bacterium]
MLAAVGTGVDASRRMGEGVRAVSALVLDLPGAKRSTAHAEVVCDLAVLTEPAGLGVRATGRAADAWRGCFGEVGPAQGLCDLPPPALS